MHNLSNQKQIRCYYDYVPPVIPLSLFLSPHALSLPVLFIHSPPAPLLHIWPRPSWSSWCCKQQAVAGSSISMINIETSATQSSWPWMIKTPKVVVVVVRCAISVCPCVCIWGIWVSSSLPPSKLRERTSRARPKRLCCSWNTSAAAWIFCGWRCLNLRNVHFYTWVIIWYISGDNGQPS